MDTTKPPDTYSSLVKASRDPGSLPDKTFIHQFCWICILKLAYLVKGCNQSQQNSLMMQRHQVSCKNTPWFDKSAAIDQISTQADEQQFEKGVTTQRHSAMYFQHSNIKFCTSSYVNTYTKRFHFEIYSVKLNKNSCWQSTKLARKSLMFEVWT